ncbi:hypothetical protein H0H81_011132 [Sphagnurus paluster]|uniref:Uncharacterized protein n=1 Tax=Sphagnurus paluster TaxID=117069 RepID=A0A9P7GUM5_9AGAR|nr:hypothetical protein H0H81_011132 [Sphagnurus paluster]
MSLKISEHSNFPDGGLSGTSTSSISASSSCHGSRGLDGTDDGISDENEEKQAGHCSDPNTEGGDSDYDEWERDWEPTYYDSDSSDGDRSARDWRNPKEDEDEELQDLVSMSYRWARDQEWRVFNWRRNGAECGLEQVPDIFIDFWLLRRLCKECSNKKWAKLRIDITQKLT